MSYMETLKEAFDVMLHPGQGTKRQMSIGEALKFYYKVMIIPLIVGIIFSFAMGAIFAGAAVAALSVMILYYIIAFPIGILIDAGIYHIIIGKLFRLYKGSYDRVVNAFTYAIIPAVFVYWIVLGMTGSSIALGAGGHLALGASSAFGAVGIAGLILTLIFGVWSFIIMIVALAGQLNMSRLKAFGTLILEGVIIGIIYTVIIAATGAGLAAIGI